MRNLFRQTEANTHSQSFTQTSNCLTEHFILISQNGENKLKRRESESSKIEYLCV